MRTPGQSPSAFRGLILGALLLPACYLSAFSHDSGAARDCATRTPFYRDADGDGYGNPLDLELACAADAGYVANGADCDDADPLHTTVCWTAGDEGRSDSDAGDSGTGDSGAGDTATGDTAPGDTGPADSGPSDSGSGDTGPSDTGSADSGPSDSGPSDSGLSDPGPSDTGSPDSGSSDTATPDTGPPPPPPPPPPPSQTASAAPSGPAYAHQVARC